MICHVYTAAFLLQAEIDLFVLLQDTGTVARIVIAVLLIFSIWSWGIIFAKSLLFRKVRSEARTFWKIFKRGQSLSEIATACETLRYTPLVPVFNAGAELLQPRARHSQGNLALATAPVSIGMLQRTIQRAASAQLSLLENRLNFLATTASVTPFVGLFGTVWGVLTSFTGLANTDTASLRAVAPGIAEALITTALGLFTAIPALIAYNHFVHQLRNLGGQLDDLQTEMLAIGERNGL